MQIFQDFLDQSKRLNQAPKSNNKNIQLQGPNQQYSAVYYGLSVPNLPAPLHYLNFISWLGQPKISVFQNAYSIKTTELDTATVMSSISAHMVGQFQHYSLKNDCQLKDVAIHFGVKESIIGRSDTFSIQREDSELSFNLEIQATEIKSCLTKLRLGLAEYWSVMSHCQGQIKYQNQIYEINQLAALSYAQFSKFSYLPLAFFTQQIINLSQQRQIVLVQTRDRYNNILSSRLYLRDFKNKKVLMMDQNVHLKIQRVYPVVKTPNLQKMYLPREFEWICHNDQMQIYIQAQSRGDFKFGLGAGYAGSFNFQIKINDEIENGEGGYCEYVDCRPLSWQEKNHKDKLMDKFGHAVPFMLKK